MEALCTEQTMGRIIIGNGTSIQPYVHIGAVIGISIGRDVLIASGVYITDHDHYFEDPLLPPIGNGTVVASPVSIGDYTWIGERAMVLKGVTIGEHSIIGAGAIVTKDIPAYCCAAGSPARVIRKYSVESHCWVRFDGDGK